MILIFSPEQKQMTTSPPNRRGKGAPTDELRTKRCYHIEYFLLPDDLVPRKMDLMVFGMVAKLFAESESKVRDMIRLGNPTHHAWGAGGCFPERIVLVVCSNNCLAPTCTHRFGNKY